MALERGIKRGHPQYDGHCFRIEDSELAPRLAIVHPENCPHDDELECWAMGTWHHGGLDAVWSATMDEDGWPNAVPRDPGLYPLGYLVEEYVIPFSGTEWDFYLFVCPAPIAEGES